jgi:hypothetical protein
VKRRHPESDLQRSVAQYLWAALPPSVLWTSIDHSGPGRVRNAMLQARGVKAGVSDILICWQSGVDPKGTWCDYAAVGWIELKSGKGVISSTQVAWANQAQEFGHRFALCRSVDDVARALKEWGVPTREADPLPRHRSKAPDTLHQAELMRTVPSRKR